MHASTPMHRKYEPALNHPAQKEQCAAACGALFKINGPQN